MYWLQQLKTGGSVDLSFTGVCFKVVGAGDISRGAGGNGADLRFRWLYRPGRIRQLMSYTVEANREYNEFRFNGITVDYWAVRGPRCCSSCVTDIATKKPGYPPVLEQSQRLGPTTVRYQDIGQVNR
jgi:hypothetical protein